jgi:hypothetical protein
MALTTSRVISELKYETKKELTGIDRRDRIKKRMKDERQAAFHSAFRLPPADLFLS